MVEMTQKPTLKTNERMTTPRTEIGVAFLRRSGQIFLHRLEGIGPMRIVLLILLVVATGACVTGPARNAASAWTDGVKFASMGQGTGAFSATLDGNTSQAAPYTIRVHITKGGKIQPHTHPDTRFITVVAGE